MNNIIFLLLTQLLVNGILCDDFLSKFHQLGFKLKDVRTEVVRYNRSLFNTFEIKTYKYNRTTAAINATMNFKIDLQDKLEVVQQTYKYVSNEYRHFPMRFQVNVKKCYDANIIGLANIHKCGNFTNFYFYKDITYYACNFVIDETHMPPLIPNGIYNGEFTFLYLNREAAVINLFSEVYTPMVYP